MVAGRIWLRKKGLLVDDCRRRSAALPGGGWTVGAAQAGSGSLFRAGADSSLRQYLESSCIGPGPALRSRRTTIILHRFGIVARHRTLEEFSIYDLRFASLCRLLAWTFHRVLRARLL